MRVQQSSLTTENVLLVFTKFHGLILVRTNLVYSSGDGISCLLNFVLGAFSSILVALLCLFIVYCRLVLQPFALGAGSLSCQGLLLELVLVPGLSPLTLRVLQARDEVMSGTCCRDQLLLLSLTAEQNLTFLFFCSWTF